MVAWTSSGVPSEVICETASMLPLAIRHRNAATCSPGWSSSGRKCSTATNSTPTGAEIDQGVGNRIVQDDLRSADIPLDRRHTVVCREQGSGVGTDHGVVVDVKHAGIRQDFPGNLVHIRLGG